MTYKFNPYKEAAGDYAAIRNATRSHWKMWCRKCNKEKPMKDGKGSGFGRNGTVGNYVCADCLGESIAT